MPELFVTSDGHLLHGRINELAGRPFSSTEEMSEEIIRRHNEWVGPKDTVWMVGDVAMGDVADSLAMCKRMNGKKILISGNHDRTWAGYKLPASQTTDDWVKRYKEEGGFTTVITGGAFQRHPRTSVPIRVPLGFGSRPVDMWHFPRSTDDIPAHTETNGLTPVSDQPRVDKYAMWRPRKSTDGTWLLHGHVHEKWKVRHDTREINVGVDVWNFEPVHISKIIEAMNSHPNEGGSGRA